MQNELTDKMSRKWVHKVSRGKPPKDWNEWVIIIDTCAICRCCFWDDCIDCYANSPDALTDETHRKFMMWVWKFLLIEHKRKSSLFKLLDMNVISKVYEYAITSSVKLPNDCTILWLECGHVFHRHCFVKWTKRRLICPLDNREDFIPVAIHPVKKKTYHGKLLRIEDLSSATSADGADVKSN